MTLPFDVDQRKEWTPQLDQKLIQIREANPQCNWEAIREMFRPHSARTSNALKTRYIRLKKDQRELDSLADRETSLPDGPDGPDGPDSPGSPDSRGSPDSPGGPDGPGSPGGPN